jgi:hypothetical protein
VVKTVPENKARQGRLGRPVLIILIAALLLALAAWGGVELYGEMIKTPATQQNQTTGG